jgi:hypothetical protein
MGNRTRKIAEILGKANHSTGKISSDNLDVNFTDTVFSGNEGITIPVGTSAQRGSTTGQWRFNSDTGFFEGRNASTFQSLAPAPTISSIDVSEIDSNSGGTTNIVLTGTNFTSDDTVVIIPNSGSNITPNSYTHTNASSKTINVTDSDFVNANEPYSIRITGLGGQYTLDNAINVDSAPTWTTSAGSLGTIDHSELAGAYTLTTVAASDADGDTIAYTKTTGTLPTGLILNSSTGAWSGTVTGIVSTTTNNFTLRATANSKTTDRSFSIIQEGELDNYSTQYAFSFNGDTDNAGSNTDTYVTAGSFVSNSTGQTKFNANSAYFTNSGYSSFKIPNSTDLQFGTGQFTIEGWLFLVNDSSNVDLSARIFQMGENNSNGIALIYNFTDEFTFSNTHTNFLTDSPSNWLGNWRYFTVDYDGTTYRLYRDGVVVSTATSGFNSVNISDDLYFGVYPGGLTATRTNMYLSEWQITKGVAKYAGAFTPKTGAFLT